MEPARRPAAVRPSNTDGNVMQTAAIWFMFACFFLAILIVSLAWLLRD